VVQVDAHVAVGVALVAKGVVDVDLLARRRVREGVVAHRLRRRPVEVDLVVVELDGLPAPAAVDREAGVLASVLVVVHRLGADEVRHGALARRAEGVVRRLGRLEEHVAVAVAVELARRVASGRNVVALVGVHLRDDGDLLGPQLLGREDLSLRDRCRLRRIGDRRVVEADAHLAVLAPLVAESVLDADLVPGGGVREDVVAHGVRNFAVELDLVVVELDITPAPAAVDGEAGILTLELVVLHRLRADKVRHGLLARRAERVLRRLGRLEEDVAVAVAVELTGRFACGRDEVALVSIHL